MATRAGTFAASPGIERELSQANREGIGLSYSLTRRVIWAMSAMGLGVLIAGFWNYKLVDGFGRQVVAANTIGNTQHLASTYASNGMAFGLIFAAVAGVAATFTACNCVVFAMLPGLACGTDRSAGRRTALQVLLRFGIGVIAVGALYGAFVGNLGAAAAAKYNAQASRLLQAETVFTILGVALVIWGAVEFGFLRFLTNRLPAGFRQFMGATTTRAGIMGVIVGTFAIGRPYPVFRDLLAYAASSHNPLYGALIMSVQGVGQIALMVILFLILVWAFGGRLARWAAARPAGPVLLTAVALVAGGSYFIFYWGIALSTHIGSWGFRLGLYS
jgi:hypothetical protein